MSKHLEIEQQAAAWLAKKDGGRWTARDQAELEHWFSLATAHRVAYLRLAATWSKADQISPAAPMSSVQPPQPIHEIGRRRPLPRFSRWRIAAAILVTVGAGAGAMAVRANLGEVRYETQLGAHQTLALKDGSKITLNTATLVRSRVSQTERIVWLDKGEAYFEVAHDAAHPFVVMAGASRITVLGTRFAVRRDANGTKVVVIDGRVQVENGHSSTSAPVVLAKHQKVLATPGAMLKSDESDAEIEQTMGWREGKLVFDQVSLDFAASEFNRYNKIKLVMGDAEAAKVQIGGRFDVGNVKGFTNLLQQGFGLDVHEADGTIMISSHGAVRAAR